MPISKPIQCTDTGDVACSESPFFRLKGSDQCVEPSKTKANDVLPLEPKEISSLLLDLHVQIPPREDQYNFLASVADKKEVAGVPCADINSDTRPINSNYALFFKNYAAKFLDMDSTGEKIAPAKLYLDFLTPISRDSNLSFSNIYEDINFLQSKDISLGTLLEPHKNSNGVRGPAQSSWSPGCLSEDCPFGQQGNSDVTLSSQICEFCDAVFPAGAATEGEFLGHLAGHME
ncbi:hypothetical protein PRIEUP_LOCUS1611 [Pristimantis euphronides]